eukprot:4326930-Pyramimonas_sp.AAC.2
MASIAKRRMGGSQSIIIQRNRDEQKYGGAPPDLFAALHDYLGGARRWGAGSLSPSPLLLPDVDDKT